MKPSRIQTRLMLAMLAIPLLFAGCGGISATRSVSPLDFLLPGAGGFLLQAAPPATNNLVLPPQPQQQLAFAR